MGKRPSGTTLRDAEIKRAANALRKAGRASEAKRLENNLPEKPRRK